MTAFIISSSLLLQEISGKFEMFERHFDLLGTMLICGEEMHFEKRIQDL